MLHQYKSYTIVITSWANLDPDGFRPEYRISRKAPPVSQSLKINQTFSTRKKLKIMRSKSPKNGLMRADLSSHRVG